MKQLILLSGLFLLIGCGSEATQESAATDSIRRADDSMNNAVTYSADSTRVPDSIAQARWLDSVAKDSVTNAEPTYHADFRILYTYAYCGGARPTEEMETEHNTPKPLTSSTLKFKNHHTGKEYFLKTDANGKASGEMEEGKYDVFFTKDINSGIATGFDPKCSLWLNQLLITVKVTATGKAQDVNVHFVCNPCDSQSKMRP